RCGGDRKRSCERRRGRRLASAAERDVRPPLAGGGRPSRRADDAAACDDEAKIPADGWDELMHEPPVLAEPAAERRPLERRGELVAGLAEDDVAPPAAEPRLEHDGK